MEVLKRLHYDVVTIGNHEWDKGLSNVLEQTAKLSQVNNEFETAVPLINSNIIKEASGELVFTPHHIFSRNGIKIGVCGLLGRNAFECIIDTARVGLAITDPVETLMRESSFLRDQGCDIVLCLSHCGTAEDAVLCSHPGADILLGGGYCITAHRMCTELWRTSTYARDCHLCFYLCMLVYVDRPLSRDIQAHSDRCP
jgi:5'-nucleotidase